MEITVNDISKGNPPKGVFYLAFDTAWFTAFYLGNNKWTYNRRLIQPTHWAKMPNNPKQK